jgi:hypothetical protein
VKTWWKHAEHGCSRDGGPIKVFCSVTSPWYKQSCFVFVGLTIIVEFTSLGLYAIPGALPNSDLLYFLCLDEQRWNHHKTSRIHYGKYRRTTSNIDDLFNLSVYVLQHEEGCVYIGQYATELNVGYSTDKTTQLKRL